MSIALQLVVIIIAIAAFIFLTVKGLGPIISGLVAAAIVAFIAIGGFSANLFGTFLDGMAGMIGSFFVLFSCGCAFGSVLAVCGASDRMGTTLVKVFGEKNFIFSILIVSCLFGLTGAPPLALMPTLCFGMMKKANLPRYIAMTAVAGSTAFSLTAFPGSLGMANVLPTAFLGTNVYAAPALGIICCIVGFVLLSVYLMRLIKDARTKGIGYDAVEGNILMGSEIRSEDDMPGFFCSIIPVVVLLGGCAVLILGFSCSSVMACFVSTVVSILLMILLNRKYIHVNIMESLRDSVLSIQGNIVGAIVVVGFAAVIQNTELYNSVVGALLQSNMSPILLTTIAVFIISALCADCNGGVAAFAASIGTQLVAAGAPAAVVHRMATIACGVFDSMPHGGSMILALGLFGYNHKQAYKYLAISNIVIPLVYTLICLGAASILY